jgi:hypothetical protein
MNAPRFTLAESVADLPEYPIAADERLQSHYFVELHFRRWLTSETRLLADLEVRGLILDLIMLAQDQTPVGTLPTDHRLIAKMIGLSAEQFAIYCGRDVSPLHKWTRCRVGDQVRLMHPVVAEIASRAVGMRRDREAENARRRAAKALKDLDARLRSIGCSRIADSRTMVERIDHWLAENCNGNRTELMIRQAIEVVSRAV